MKALFIHVCIDCFFMIEILERDLILAQKGSVHCNNTVKTENHETPFFLYNIPIFNLEFWFQFVNRAILSQYCDIQHQITFRGFMKYSMIHQIFRHTYFCIELAIYLCYVVFFIFCTYQQTKKGFIGYKNSRKFYVCL